jgi:hypothetical protein
MNDIIIAAVRRVVVSGVAVLLVWLAAHLGVGVDSQTSTVVTGFVVAVAIAVWGWVAQMVEQRYPWLGKILFLGATRNVTYTKH